MNKLLCEAKIFGETIVWKLKEKLLTLTIIDGVKNRQQAYWNGAYVDIIEKQQSLINSSKLCVSAYKELMG